MGSWVQEDLVRGIGGRESTSWQPALAQDLIAAVSVTSGPTGLDLDTFGLVASAIAYRERRYIEPGIARARWSKLPRARPALSA